MSGALVFTKLQE
jgi:transposase InsO family protein